MRLNPGQACNFSTLNYAAPKRRRVWRTCFNRVCSLPESRALPSIVVSAVQTFTNRTAPSTSVDAIHMASLLSKRLRAWAGGEEVAGRELAGEGR